MVFLTTASSWKCYSSCMLLAVTRDRRTAFEDLRPNGKSQATHMQRWEDLLSSCSEWWNNKMNKGSTGHPDLRHSGAGEYYWVNKQDGTVWVDSQLATMEGQLQSGPGWLQRCLSLDSFELCDELRSLCEEGQLNRALEMLFRMDEQGTVPSVDMYTTLLKACTKRKALAQAKRVHLHLAQNGLESTRFLGESVVSTLVKCGSLEDALQVFQRLPNRTVFSWTAVIAGYTTAGQGEAALRLYRTMREEGLEPDKYIFASLLKACGSITDLDEGKRIHAEALKYRCDSDIFVGTCLLHMYAKCGSIVDAQNAFDGLSQRDVVSWNAMLTAYARQGQAEEALQLYERMLWESVRPDDRTIVSVLQACGLLAEKEKACLMDGLSIKKMSLEKGKALHCEALGRGYNSDVFVGSTLVNIYGKCGSIGDAHRVFKMLPERNVVSWTAMLTAVAQQGEVEMTLELYGEMLEEGVSPDARIFVTLLQACGMVAEREEDDTVDGQLIKLKPLDMGKVLHYEAWRRGHRSEIFIGSALISMYGKCGSIVDGWNVFHGLSQRNVVTWSAMLTACAQQGQAEKGVDLYVQMSQEGVSPDDRTFVCALQACGMFAEKEEEIVVDGTPMKVQSLGKGKELHSDAWRKGYKSDLFIANTLISMYGKCGSIVDAQNVFDGLLQSDLVSWNAMLAAYIHKGQEEKALQLFRQMQEEDVSPNEITFMCILGACSNTGSLDICSQIHHDVISTRKCLSTLMGNTLIHAYGSCASMRDAQNVFDALSQPDVVSWNALIAGYSRQGKCEASLECYKAMQLAGMHPDGVTFLSLLSACSHAGWVDKGVEYFESMSRDHGIAPEIGHYVSMVDLLGRAGFFDRVESLLATMPIQPNLSLWLCLLGTCRKHGKIVLARKAFECAVHLQPKHAAAYVLMSNIYAHAGLWDHAKEVNALEQKAGTWKKPGQCWIEHEQNLHFFMVGDQIHSQQEEVYELLGRMSLEVFGGGHHAK